MKKCDLLIIATFPSNKIGMQDKLERIKYLINHFDTWIISNSRDLKKEISKSKFISINCFIPGMAPFEFICRVINILNKFNAKVTFLLGTNLAPLSLFCKNKIIIYGNTSIQLTSISNFSTIRNFIIESYRHIKSTILYPWIKLGLQKADKIIVISPMLKKLFYNNGVQLQKMIIVDMGIDIKKFKRKRTKGPILKIVTLGSLIPDRGLYLLKEMMAEILRRRLPIELTHIGIIPKEYLNEDILKFIDNINLINPIDHTKLALSLKEYDVGISLLKRNKCYEYSPPQKIFEFMAVGLPVIANYIRTHTAYIKDKKNGLIINWDKKELIDALLKLHSNNRLYNNIRKNNLKKSINFDLNDMLVKTKREIIN